MKYAWSRHRSLHNEYTYLRIDTFALGKTDDHTHTLELTKHCVCVCVCVSHYLLIQSQQKAPSEVGPGRNKTPVSAAPEQGGTSMLWCCRWGVQKEFIGKCLGPSLILRLCLGCMWLEGPLGQGDFLKWLENVTIYRPRDVLLFSHQVIYAMTYLRLPDGSRRSGSWSMTTTNYPYTLSGSLNVLLLCNDSFWSHDIYCTCPSWRGILLCCSPEGLFPFLHVKGFFLWPDVRTWDRDDCVQIVKPFEANL